MYTGITLQFSSTYFLLEITIKFYHWKSFCNNYDSSTTPLGVWHINEPKYRSTSLPFGISTISCMSLAGVNSFCCSPWKHYDTVTDIHIQPSVIWPVFIFRPRYFYLRKWKCHGAIQANKCQHEFGETYPCKSISWCWNNSNYRNLPIWITLGCSTRSRVAVTDLHQQARSVGLSWVTPEE